MPSFPLFAQLPGEIQNLIFEFAFYNTLPRLQPQVTTAQINPDLGCLSSRHFSGSSTADLQVLSRNTPNPLPPLLLTCSRSGEVANAILRRISAARLAGTYGDFMFFPAGMMLDLIQAMPSRSFTFASQQQRMRSSGEVNRWLIAHTTPLILGLDVYEDRDPILHSHSTSYLMNSFHRTRLVDLTFELVPKSSQVLTQEAVDCAFRKLSNVFNMFKATRVYQNFQLKYLMGAPRRGELPRSTLERWSPGWYREAFGFVGIGSAVSYFSNYDAHFLFEQGKVPLLQETMDSRRSRHSSRVQMCQPVVCMVSDRIADIEQKIETAQAELKPLENASYVPDYNEMRRRTHRSQMLRMVIMRLKDQLQLWNEWVAIQD